jgi:hypothetical protein
MEEIQGMVRILTSDVEYLKQRLRDSFDQLDVAQSEMANRRFYVRSVFSLIEAVVEQHKRLILDLMDRNKITLGKGIREVLSETIYVVKDNGTIGQREQYLQLERKLRAVYRAADEAFGQHIAITFGDEGWKYFRKALDVRDRLTHPKTFDDCDVDEIAIETVDLGHTWFRELNNEFVRVARIHRENHGW